MQYLEGSGTPVLYIGRMVLKGYNKSVQYVQFKKCVAVLQYVRFQVGDGQAEVLRIIKNRPKVTSQAPMLFCIWEINEIKSIKQKLKANNIYIYIYINV